MIPGPVPSSFVVYMEGDQVIKYIDMILSGLGMIASIMCQWPDKTPSRVKRILVLSMNCIYPCQLYTHDKRWEWTSDIDNMLCLNRYADKGQTLHG